MGSGHQIVYTDIFPQTSMHLNRSPMPSNLLSPIQQLHSWGLRVFLHSILKIIFHSNLKNFCNLTSFTQQYYIFVGDLSILYIRWQRTATLCVNKWRLEILNVYKVFSSFNFKKILTWGIGLITALQHSDIWYSGGQTDHCKLNNLLMKIVGDQKYLHTPKRRK